MKKSRFSKVCLTPYKRRLQVGHADGWGLGGPHTDDGDQISQIPNSGSNPLEVHSGDSLKIRRPLSGMSFRT